MIELTTDSFFSGRIQVKQDRCGYRFSIDAVLLANHVRVRPDDTILDLGAGCGIIPLILAYRYPKVKIFGVELQNELALLAAQNVQENKMKDRIEIVCADMKTLKMGMVNGPVDLVVSNPPFRKAHSGRMNPNLQKAVARHEIRVTLREVIAVASRMLRKGGRSMTIYPAERITDILTQMRTAGIEPKFVRMIHSQEHKEAKLTVVEGIKGGRPGVKVAAPLFIYRPDGSYTDEIAVMFSP